MTTRQTGGAVAIIPVRESDLVVNGQPRTLGGKALLGYTVRAAREAALVDRVIVSTEGTAAAELARALGAEVPFVRPADLARPGVTIWQVLQHALTWLEANGAVAVDTVVLLETSHPIRPKGLIDRVIEALRSSDCDSVLTAHEERHAFWLQDPSGALQQVGVGPDATRAERPPLFREAAGLACASRAGLIREGRGPGRNVGIVPVRSWVGLIDTQDPFGLLVAEKMLAAMAEGSAPTGESYVGLT